jgi:hypothetical protein
MGRWDQHVCSWVDQRQLPVLIIRYEDMLCNGSTTFAKLTRFFGLPDEQGLVNQALDNTSIAKLRTLEDKVGGFADKRGGHDHGAQATRIGLRTAINMSSKSTSPLLVPTVSS